MNILLKLACLIIVLFVMRVASADEVIKIGVMVPLTGGTVASHGEQVRDGILLARSQSIKNYEGACGGISFDNHGDVIKPLKFKKIRNGKRVDFDEG